MKIVYSEKEMPKAKKLCSQPSDTVFTLYNERDINLEDRDYYIVLARNGHREYYNLADGNFRPLNADCPVLVIDCALAVYGIKE